MTRTLSTSMHQRLRNLQDGPGVERRPLVAVGPDAALLAIFGAPARPGELASMAYARKEREAIAVLAELSPLDSLRLRQRLEARRSEDPLVAAFEGLVVERRVRLLAFLRDAGRRHALATRVA